MLTSDRGPPARFSTPPLRVCISTLLNLYTTLHYISVSTASGLEQAPQFTSSSTLLPGFCPSTYREAG
jgi:hypothetical protein